MRTAFTILLTVWASLAQAAGGLLLGTPQNTFVINYAFVSGGEPAYFITAVNTVMASLQATIHDPITVNIDVRFQALCCGQLGNSGPADGVNPVTYANLKAALTAHINSADDATAVANMSVSDPVPGGAGNYYIPNAEAKALGLLAPRATLPDGNVYITNNVTWDPDPSDGITPGTYDLQGILYHEITHAFGRVAFLASIANTYTPEDLFRYTGPGVHNFVAATSTYFSIDNGTTNLHIFDTVKDAGWSGVNGLDSFNFSAGTGNVLPFSAVDHLLMDILGFNVQ